MASMRWALAGVAACVAAAGGGGAAMAADPAGTPAPAVTSAAVAPGAWEITPGLAFSLNYTGQAAANPIGGVRQSQELAGQFFFGVDADLGTLAGLEGSSVHVAVTKRHGDSLSQTSIGNSTSVQEIYGGGQNTRLTKLSWEQKLFDGRLDVEAGRIVANTDFLSSPIYCQFQTNSACGNPTFVFRTSNFTYWPVSSWGGHAKAWLTDSIFLHGGIYEVNPRRALPTDHGLNWSTKDATGVIMPFELGYATTFDTDAMPRHYGIGGWYDTSDYADPLRDINGNPSVLTGLPSLTRSNRSGVYARFDQMVWRPDPDAHRGLALFGVAMTGTSGTLAEDYFLELGALMTGPLATRPLDTMGFVINTQRFSKDTIRAIEVAQNSLGIDRHIPRQQIMMELNYGLQLDPAVKLTPNFQYIVNPDQIATPFRTKNIPDAVVVGAKLSVDFFTLAGLAKGPQP